MPVLPIPASQQRPEPVRLRVLGSPVLHHGDDSLPFAPERRFQLLALLAHRPEWIGRERLATLLWPQLALERARANLRRVLFGLREWQERFALTIEDQHGALRWQVTTDVQAFEAALAAGELATAVDLWCGEPWQGMDGVPGGDGSGFDDWLRYERQRLRSSWRGALLRLCQAEPEPARQSAWAERLLAHDPLDEEAVQLKMRAAARTGRPAVARIYDPFAKALAEAAGIEPSTRTRALLEPATDVAVAKPAPAPAQTDADTDFTGRGIEQRELAELLARPEGRWVTLLGPGGIGKTRFLKHVLPALAPAFAQGTVYVPLDDLDRAEQVLPRLAQRLGQRLEEAEPALPQLQRALQGRKLLLALDNLEHVRAVVPLLSELLDSCPSLRLVATSRERADVPGEWAMPLEGLPFPEADDVDRAEGFDAVQLFVRRALASQPRFSLERERAAVVRLCTLVEGMPLALELAAVWTRHFSVDEIVRDLEAGGAMLVEPQSGRVPRHQSIALTFEHSWKLLAEAERDALVCLSVFAGGFTREAAQWVSGAPLGVLMALIDKSLVRKESATLPARFGFHPLLQQFLRARLEAQPEWREAVERRHAAFYGRLLARQQLGPSARDWVAETDADTENILLAWDHAVRWAMAPLLADALIGFSVHAYRTGHWERGLAALNAARPLHPERGLESARLFLYLAKMQLVLGFYREGARSLQEALPVLREVEDYRPFSECLFLQGMARFRIGDFTAGEASFREALALVPAGSSAVGHPQSLMGLVSVMRAMGRYDEAIETAKQAHQDDEWWSAHVADFHRLAGRPAHALSLLTPALAAPAPASRDSFWLDCRWTALQTAAAAHFALGDLDRAEHFAELALAAQHELGRGRVPVTTLATCFLRSRLAWLRGDAATAHRLLAEATSIASRQRLHHHLAHVAVHWAQLLAALGEREHVATILRMAWAEPTIDAETRAIALALAEAALVSSPLGDPGTDPQSAMSTADIILLVRSAETACHARIDAVSATRGISSPLPLAR